MCDQKKLGIYIMDHQQGGIQHSPRLLAVKVDYEPLSDFLDNLDDALESSDSDYTNPVCRHYFCPQENALTNLDQTLDNSFSIEMPLPIIYAIRILHYSSQLRRQGASQYPRARLS
jgi:hypothetical protein